MREPGKDVRSMTEMRITAVSSGKAPDYSRTAGLLLTACREFFKDPENEKAYREWMAGREEKREKAV